MQAAAAIAPPMLNDRSSLLSLLETRRSGKPRELVGPGPAPGELERMLSIAARTPDHGTLTPWRFVTVADDRRDAFEALLQQALVENDPEAPPAKREKEHDFAHYQGTLVVLISVGVGWTHLGRQLDRVARAGAVMEPGTRLAWLGFEPEADAPYGVRGTALLRHAWAIPARERRQLVAFGFENFRHSMVRAWRDARPPLPEGANEFSAILWDEALKPPPFVYLERHFSARNITSAARLLLPTLAAPDILPRLRQAVLSQAGREFHYLLVGNPPAAVANEIRNFEWPRVYQDDGVEVYRLGRALDDLSLGGTARPPGRPAGKRRASTHPESAAGSGDGADATSR